MRALIPDESGALRLTNTATPDFGAEEVLLKVDAAGINRADLSQLAGHYPPPAGASDILGLEAAGVVREVGAKVATQWLNERACALLTGGGYAELVAVPAAMLMPVPAAWSPAQAAAFPETAFTAYLNLFLEARLQPGERVLIHGGASGVGSAAIRQAKLAGCYVVATSGGPEKVAACGELGADLSVDRHAGPFGQQLRDHGIDAVDVILDMVGEAYFAANLDLLATGGRLVLISTLSGREANFDIRQLMAKRAHIIGSTLRSRPLAEKVRIKESFLARFGPALLAGALDPVIDSVYGWERVAEAHQRMRANENIGKLVLAVS